MPGKAKLLDVIDALESADDEHQPYLDRRTGRTVIVRYEFAGMAEEDEGFADVPDWQQEAIREARKVQDEEEHFLALPDKFEIHEWEIMERFSHSRDKDRERDALLDAIHGRGAFRRFKDAATRLGVIEQWYAYRDQEIRQIAVDWLEENGIEYEEQ